MNERFSALALVIFWIGHSPDAQALPQSCGPLKQVASLKMSVLPDGSRVSVPLTIDGKAVSLLVDTGAGASSLTKTAATMLGIRQRDSEKMQLVNADGAAIHHYYLADDFQFGHLTAKNVPFMQNVDIDNASVGGAIGPDLMLRYDVDMNFSEQKLTYFSQDHCRGRIVHWQTDAVTQVPISIVPRAKDYPPPLVNGAVAGLSSDFVTMAMALANGAPILGTDIRVKVMLDGHAFTANIDTGLDISTINSKAARDCFDVSLDDRPDKPETHQPQPAQPSPGTETVTVTARRQQHQFHSLTFGGVTVTNPIFVMKPGPMGVHRAGDPDPPDITVGMNVLRKLHLYFAFRERMLYVSTAGPVQTQTGEDKDKGGAP